MCFTTRNLVLKFLCVCVCVCVCAHARFYYWEVYLYFMTLVCVITGSDLNYVSLKFIDTNYTISWIIFFHL